MDYLEHFLILDLQDINYIPKCRTPKSLLAGLMWLGVKEGHYSLRHTCEESDKLSRYAWVRHDGATYGQQVSTSSNTHFFCSARLAFLRAEGLGLGLEFFHFSCMCEGLLQVRFDLY